MCVPLPISGAAPRSGTARDAVYHFQPLSAGRPSSRLQPAGVGCIGPDDFEPQESPPQFGQHQPGPVPVLDVGGVNDHSQEQSSAVHYDVALTSEQLLASFKPRDPFLRSFHRLAVDDGRAGRGMPSLVVLDHGACAPSPCSQMPPFPISGNTTRPCATGASFAKVSRSPPPAGEVHGCPFRKS